MTDEQFKKSEELSNFRHYFDINNSMHLSQMGKLKNALDAETTSRLELSHNADSMKLIAQSDLRVQALSVLLLHYCAGLQHAQEALDRPETSKES